MTHMLLKPGEIKVARLSVELLFSHGVEFFDFEFTPPEPPELQSGGDPDIDLMIKEFLIEINEHRKNKTSSGFWGKIEKKEKEGCSKCKHLKDRSYLLHKNEFDDLYLCSGVCDLIGIGTHIACTSLKCPKNKFEKDVHDAVKGAIKNKT